MTTPFAAPGRWIADPRGGGRGVRVSSHVEGGFLVLSTWREDACVATVRLLPDEAASLVAGLAEGLGRLADADFDLDAFRHRAVWDERNHWMDIRMVAQSPQHVTLRALDLELDFAAGEQIRTEISAKYDRPKADALLRAGGFETVEWLTDDERLFALALAEPTPD